MAKGDKKNTKKKFSKKKFSIFLFILGIIIFVIRLCITNITNIYISGNEYLTDQDIIEISQLDNYPNSITNPSYIIEKRLKNHKYILDVEINKNIFLNKIIIKVIENYPLFYYSVKDKTVLYNGDTIDGNVSNLTIINSIKEEVYTKFLEKIKQIDVKILNRVSEIEYVPNNILIDRFLLIMNDGNYIYITLDKFLTLNKYLDIIKQFSGEKGILYLDSGEYFDKFD